MRGEIKGRDGAVSELLNTARSDATRLRERKNRKVGGSDGTEEARKGWPKRRRRGKEDRRERAE